MTSVIILNWNGAKLLRQFLPSVIEHTPADQAEIVVADNGSTDDSVELLRREFPSVRLLQFDKNYGFAEGYNRAIAQCDSEYVLLLNDDVEVTAGWLDALTNHLAHHRHTAAVQPKLLSYHERERFEYAGACGGYLDQHGYPYCRGRIFDTIETDHGQYDHERPIMWASGACLLVRREVYLQAGGLDPNFFAHMEEIDLCWRIRRLGWRISCVPSSVVYHLGGGSLPQGDPKKTMLNFRNSLLMLWKNLPRRRRKHALFVRKMLDGVAALNFLLHGKIDQVKAIRTAHHEAKQMIRDIYEPHEFMHGRDGKFGRTSHFDEEDINILLAYYLFRRKTFSSL